jgi:predicted transcriptional regulator of viral defense system
MASDADRGYRRLERWADALPAKGRYAFSREECTSALNISNNAFQKAAARLGARSRLARVHERFYVVVPLEHAAVGVIPADWFIVDLMQHVKRSFYVGLLSAAEYHGAAHQRPQNYQVITNRPLRPIACRGVGIRFIVKREIEKTPVQQVKGVTGYIPVSTPEATALDLVRYCRQSGGMDHVLTVLQELAEAIDPTRLALAAEADGGLAYAQRLGWLLGKTDFSQSARRLAAWLAKRNPPPAKLEAALPLRGSPRDRRWNLWLNARVEGDLL